MAHFRERRNSFRGIYGIFKGYFRGFRGIYGIFKGYIFKGHIFSMHVGGK